MTDADGSSKAALGAPPEKPTPPQQGILKRFGLWPARIRPTVVPAHPALEGPKVSTGNSRPSLSNLRRMRIEDVATPKSEIDAVPSDIGLDALVEVFRESGYTRLPVYEGTLDTPIGMIHLKDVALKHGFNGSDVPFDMASLVRPLLYAPPSMPIGVLLQKMQSQRMHMALVIDEYGGTDGLVTIEDLIEQVVGEIPDEHDVEEDQPWSEEAPGRYLALARAPLDEFEAETGVDLSLPDSDEGADTLGGLVFLMTGRVPARGEILKHPSGIEIEVVDADPRRVKRLRIVLPGARTNGK